MKKLSHSLLPAALLFMLFCGQTGAQAASAPVTRHSITVSVDIRSRTIQGIDRITLGQDADEVRLLFRSGSEVTGAEADGNALKVDRKAYAKDLDLLTIKLPSPGKRLALSFKGKFQSPREAEEFIKRGVAYVDDGIIGEEGVFLPSSAYWFPQEQEEDALISFEAEVTLPEGYSSVMEGVLTSSVKKDSSVVESWNEWKPIEGVDLVAARYAIEKETYKGIDIYTYFFKKDDALSRTYIDKTKEHLDAFQSMIGPYPFKKFAVVENFLPTGYGMPSFTLLGSTVIRLPFIPATSLGHEIAHNWWGNSVFIDSSMGNWAEAITTFVADYRYERAHGGEAAREFRSAKLRGYKNFAEDAHITLREFRDATSSPSRAVGYNKGLMVFNMLELSIGQEKFNAGIKMLYSQKAFERASWQDIQDSFEAASGQDLDWFFDQWLKRIGGPRLSLHDAVSVKKDGRNAVTFTLKQDSKAYVLDLPVFIKTPSGEVWKTVRLSKETEEFAIELDDEPISMEIDPQIQNFRLLADEEVPATIAGILGDRRALIVIPNKSRLYDQYLRAADLLARDYNLEIITDAEAGRQDNLWDRSLFIFGGPLENRFALLTGQYFSRHIRFDGGSIEIKGKSYPKGSSTAVVAIKNPHMPSKTLALLTGPPDREALMETAKRVRYFTDFSYLVFTRGKVEKGLFEGDKVLKHIFK